MNRYTGGIFVAPLLGTALFVLVSFDAQWRGEWNWTVDTVTGSTVLTAPLAGSVGAYIAATQRRLDPLIAPSVRGWLVPVLSGFRAWLLALGVYAITCVTALTMTFLANHGGPLSLWALLIGPAVLAFCCMAGAALGWWWPHRLAAVFAAPALFLVGAFGPGPVADLLRQGPVTGSLAGLKYDARVWCLQVCALTAATVLIACALVPRRRSRKTLAKAAGAAVVSGSIFIGACLGLMTENAERFAASSEKPTSCMGAPQACLAPSNVRFLEDVSQALSTASEVLQGAGVNMPERYEQLLAGYQPPETSGLLTNVDDSPFSDLRRGAILVARPAACAAWTDPSEPPPDEAFQAQELLTEWIVGSGGEETYPWSAESEEWLSRPHRTDRTAWVVRTFSQLRRCQLSEVAMPWAVPQ
ncbi:hypothetical protein [Nocardioides sp. WS12]|uniref:hypothetical protein n=1 Tax=Nocardioides sp. WS12 TaxID=2486272 RepID=UPI0015FD1E68|nr:hypothetical protein [Nocardioides sp. WS12]